MNVLCIGDVVGKPGREALGELLEKIKTEYKIDFVVVNGENAAGGSGITSNIANYFCNDLGIDVITLGDHVWDQKEFLSYLVESEQVIRPANFPEDNQVPGKGWCVRTTASGQKVGVINMLGRVFMRYSVDCPFRKTQAIIEEIQKETPIVIIDFHAETTSEKVAMGHYVDGKASLLFGTHTHIQTADETILSGGTAYITDLGMSGPYDSVIGQNKQNILDRFLTSMPIKFAVAEGNVKLCGVIVEVDDVTGKAKSISRLQENHAEVAKSAN